MSTKDQRTVRVAFTLEVDVAAWSMVTGCEHQHVTRNVRTWVAERVQSSAMARQGVVRFISDPAVVHPVVDRAAGAEFANSTGSVEEEGQREG